MSNKLSFLLTVMMLLYSGNGINWQGTGNLTSDNLTFIWNQINTNFQKSWKQGTVATLGQDTTIVDFASGLSRRLNSEWAQAWNVVVSYIYSCPNSDTVLYGYGFRDHWMWYNGYAMDDGHFVGFIIWKDYNCITWFQYNNNLQSTSYPSSSGFTAKSLLETAMTELQGTLDKSDIWKAAKEYSTKFSADPAIIDQVGRNAAFTIIMSQCITALYFGRFCAKDYVANYFRVGSSPTNWGTALILQMRSGYF